MRRNSRFFQLVGKVVFLLILFCSFSQSCRSQNEIKISYIGNMGVLIENGEQAVLIDGFHKEYKPQYLFPSEALVDELINGEHEDFAPIDIAMATHRHKDHFDPAYFHSFLNRNETSIAILSPQIKALFDTETKKSNAGLDGQIKVADYDGAVHEFDHNGIAIKSFRVDHGNPSRHKSIENTAYLIDIDGISVLHIGDSGWAEAERHLKAHHEHLKNLDVAVLPYWMLLDEDSSELVERLIDPKEIIATHIPPDFDEAYKNRISKNFENTLFFTKIGQMTRIIDRQ